MFDPNFYVQDYTVVLVCLVSHELSIPLSHMSAKVSNKFYSKIYGKSWRMHKQCVATRPFLFPLIGPRDEATASICTEIIKYETYNVPLDLASDHDHVFEFEWSSRAQSISCQIQTGIYRSIYYYNIICFNQGIYIKAR